MLHRDVAVLVVYGRDYVSIYSPKLDKTQGFVIVSLTISLAEILLDGGAPRSRNHEVESQ